MDANEYQTLSQRTANFSPTKLTNFEANILNVAMGIVGESGELADLLKKMVFHRHSFDTGKVREEIGDVLWYLSALCTLWNVNLGDVMRENVEKLRRRYPNGFSQKDSVNRE